MKLRPSLLLIGLLFTTSVRGQRSPEQAPKVVVAVAQFLNVSNSMELDFPTRQIPGLLKGELSRSPHVVVVERTRLQEVLREQALAQTGIMEEQMAQQVGQILGAEYIIYGEVSAPDHQFRIDAHMVKVATGQVIGERAVAGDRKALQKMIDLMAGNLLHTLTGDGRRREKAMVRRYPGPWVLLAAVAVAGRAIYDNSVYNQKWDDYQSADHRMSDIESFYDSANRHHKLRNIFAGAAVGLSAIGGALLAKQYLPGNAVYAAGGDRIQVAPKLAISPTGDRLALTVQVRF